jgi:acetyl-CoA acetyltransferase
MPMRSTIQKEQQRSPSNGGRSELSSDDEVVWGNANSAGQESRNVGRMAAF